MQLQLTLVELVAHPGGLRRGRRLHSAHRRRRAGDASLGFFVLAALELTPPMLSAFAARHPAVHVELQEYSFADPSVGLAGVCCLR